MKIYFIFVDMVQSSFVNVEEIRKYLSDFLFTVPYMRHVVEFLDLSKSARLVLEKVLMLEHHVFINIIGSKHIVSLNNTTTSSGKVGYSFQSKLGVSERFNNQTRYYKLLQHAFISRNRNAVYVVVEDEPVISVESMLNSQIYLQGKVDQFQFEILEDQLVCWKSGDANCMKRLQELILRKMLVRDDAIQYYLLPILAEHLSVTALKTISKHSVDRHINLAAGITGQSSTFSRSNLPTLTSHCKESITNSIMHNVVGLNNQSEQQQSSKHSLPVLILVDDDQQYNQSHTPSCSSPFSVIYFDSLVESAILDAVECSSNRYILLKYEPRIDNLAQNIDFFLVSLMLYFKITPKHPSLPLSTLQMAVEINDALRTFNRYSDDTIIVILIKNIDWIYSKFSTVNAACSWLPELISDQIRIIMTASTGSIQHKNLLKRLRTPKIINVDFKQPLISNSHLLSIDQSNDPFLNMDRLSRSLRYYMSCHKLLHPLLTMFAASPEVWFTLRQIRIILALSIADNAGSVSHSSISSIPEKSEREMLEKECILSRCCNLDKVPVDSVCSLLDWLTLEVPVLTSRCRTPYWAELQHGLVSAHLSSWLLRLLEEVDDGVGSCCGNRTGATYWTSWLLECTSDFTHQLLLVPQVVHTNAVLSPIQLYSWVANWAVLKAAMGPSFAGNVPVQLMSLWRIVLGGDTDYRPLLAAYIRSAFKSAVCVHCSIEDTCCLNNMSDVIDDNRYISDTELDSLLGRLLQTICCTGAGGGSSNSYGGSVTANISNAVQRYRCRLLLDLCNLAMHIGQYQIAKETARALLKYLDRYCHRRETNNNNNNSNSNNNSSIGGGGLGTGTGTVYGAAAGIGNDEISIINFADMDNCADNWIQLIASTLHVLFCTLDERLKTFEFVTEQTTPLFRRTMHYGARALKIQEKIVEALEGKCKRLKPHKDTSTDISFPPSCHGDGTVTSNMSASNISTNDAVDDKCTFAVAEYGSRLCEEEARLGRMMTHFVFSLDGVDQALTVNRHIPAHEIREVTTCCLRRALLIAEKYNYRQLLLEIHMTFGVIQPRENFRSKILIYHTPLRQALTLYGEGHIFVSRLYINIGISHEEQRYYLKAYNYFTLWSHVTHELLGRNHCKSIRSCGVFREPIFRFAAEFIEGLNGEEYHEDLEREFCDWLVLDGQSEELVSTSLSVNTTANEGESSHQSNRQRHNSSHHTRQHNQNHLHHNHHYQQQVQQHQQHQSTSNSSGTAGDQDMSVENVIQMREMHDAALDWEMHWSDDETPNYLSSFEDIVELYRSKKSSCISQKEMAQMILNSDLIDKSDIDKEDHDYILTNVPNSYRGFGAGANRSPGMRTPLDSRSDEGLTISRMFHDLQELSYWIHDTQASQYDLILTRRLQELQREMQDLLNP